MISVTRGRLSPSEWSEAVEAAPDATVFHTPAWSRVIQETYGFQPIALTVDDGRGRLEGFLPLFRVDSRITGRRLVSLPCTNVAGPLFRSVAAYDALLGGAVELARDEHCRYLEIRSVPNHDVSEASHLARVDYYESYVLDLGADLHRVRASFDKRARRGIDRANKLGVRVRIGKEPDDLRQFYHLNLLTRRKHGVPPQPLRFFERLFATLPAVADTLLALAEVEGRVVAGIIVVGYREVATYAYGASDPRFLRFSPNHALFDSVISWAIERGYRSLDFGRTAPDNRGLAEFKRQWGTRRIALPYLYWPAPAGFVARSESGAMRRTLMDAWRRLPLTITALLGPALYRHLA